MQRGPASWVYDLCSCTGFTPAQNGPALGLMLFCPFQQKVLHFHFSLGPENYGAGSIDKIVLYVTETVFLTNMNYSYSVIIYYLLVLGCQLTGHF